MIKVTGSSFENETERREKMKLIMTELPKLLLMLIVFMITGSWLFAIHQSQTIALANDMIVKEIHESFIRSKEKINTLENTIGSQEREIGSLRENIVTLKEENAGLNFRVESKGHELQLLSKQFVGTDQRPSYDDLLFRVGRLQRLYGNMVCVNKQVTPTGGFCISTEAPEIGGNEKWDINITLALEEMLFKGKTVGDFGGGLGHYTRKFRADKLVALVDCYDGAYNVEEVTNGTCKFADLTEPQPFIPVYDWILSLEVAEHIPKKLMMPFLNNLASHSREGIAISWAVPDQYGLEHVNELPNGEVIRIVESIGYTLDQSMTSRLRQLVGPACPWFRGSLLIFRKYGVINKP